MTDGRRSQEMKAAVASAVPGVSQARQRRHGQRHAERLHVHGQLQATRNRQASARRHAEFSGALCGLNNVSMPLEATVVNGLLTVVGVTPQRDQAFYLAAQ
ncbi:hypothetical protein [Caballeronia sp. AZ10_KS36]|uniref:hypothetical protein n=1 Tax=Caballeronia sp. AZ10_KS36 TaxID=2921757 RepID=UPI0020295487|nr:hypothetical protein [Caballeronia sp. AZ10_KS36]